MTCPVCGGSNSALLFRDRNRRDNIDCSGSYVQCGDCSLIYLHDPPPWEEIVRYYSSLERNVTSNSGRADAETIKKQMNLPVPRWKRLIRKFRFRPHSFPLESVPAGSKRLLDLGCGSGAKLIEFANRGYEVWGVDVGKDSIRLCKEVLPEGNFIVGELQETGLPSGHFDYIRIDNALEHVPNLAEVLAECRRLLCTGGQLMVYVPHGRSLSMALMEGDSISSWIPFHLQLFTPSSLLRLMSDSGFANVQILGFSPPSWLPLSLMQWYASKKKQKEIPLPPRILQLFCFFISASFSVFNMHEELVAIGVK